MGGDTTRKQCSLGLRGKGGHNQWERNGSSLAIFSRAVGIVNRQVRELGG